MTDKYYIIELTDDVETWRSQSYSERRLAEHIANIKQKQNPGKRYHLELQQPKEAYKF
jgi:hypothetical protein